MEVFPLRRFYLLPAAVILVAGGFTRAEAPRPSLYDKDPQHLWNRLYSALMMAAPEGESTPADLLDPQSRDLLVDGAGNRVAVALLREFVMGGPRPETLSVLQRAVMQRDMLAVFHLVAHRDGPGVPGKAWTAPERELSAALALAIRHVALTAEEIRKLPDNYAAAAGALDAVTAYDRARPGPFLPKDLLADDGPWIALGAKGKSNGSVAGFHFEVFRGRTSFEVRMRHPEGRAAGEAYLKALAGMPDPWVQQESLEAAELKPNGPRGTPWPNPQTPQFPVGTMWALVRRSMLVDVTGKLVVSPLVESVQIRVYRAVSGDAALQSPEFKAEAKALEEGKRKGDFDELLAEHYQTAFEWEMQRALLLGKGGFHLTGPEDLPYSRFVTHGARPIAGFCMQCHSPPGIHSVQSRARLFSEALARPPEFEPTNREGLDRVTVHEARRNPGWVLLQWLWQEQPGR